MRAIGLGLAGLMLVGCGDDMIVTSPVVVANNDSGVPAEGGDGGVSVVDAQPPPGCDGSKRPDQAACTIDEAFGVFVSSSKGNDVAGDGSRLRPFATLAHGIAGAKQAGRRVYACSETFSENVGFVEGVDIFGYFDCSNDWKASASKARIAPPKSPAATATNVAKETRVEGFEILAPDVTGSGASSIGLLAKQASGLHLVGSKVHAGSAGKGDDGANGIQLTESGTKDGTSGAFEVDCKSGSFTPACQAYRDAQPGGSINCVGEVGHDPAPGGSSGSGGKWTVFTISSVYYIAPLTPGPSAGLPSVASSSTAAGGPTLGTDGTDGIAGASGANGTLGANMGSFSATGYASSDGATGLAGSPGQSGGGGAGEIPIYPASFYAGAVDLWGSSGGSGASGGCPGLAAGPGKGGGASVGILAVQSALTIESSVVESSNGGATGKAGLPSDPTYGGVAGKAAFVGSSQTSGKGGAGGVGGPAGWSGSGGGGPSIAVAYSNASVPTIVASTLTPGKGGAGTLQQSTSWVIVPGSPDGRSVDRFGF